MIFMCADRCLRSKGVLFVNRKPLISTEIGSIACLVGEERAIELVARAGFDAWDFTMIGMVDRHAHSMVMTDHPLNGSGYAAYACHLRRVGEAYGIHCNQTHAPFPVASPVVRDTLLRAIEATALVGGKICIIHPGNDQTIEENAEMYHALLPYAKACGVKIACENMFNWDSDERARPAACWHHDDFLAHLRAVNDPYLVACVDIGHAEMFGNETSAPAMLRTLGAHVQALHIHDNDRRYDLHALPFTGAIDFAAVIKALKDINYQGYFTLEADSHAIGAKPDEVEGRVRELAAAADRLATMFEASASR